MNPKSKIQNPKSTEAGDPRFLLPVHPSFIRPHRAGTLPLVEVLAQFNAVVTELTDLDVGYVRLNGGDADDIAFVLAWRDQMNQLLSRIVETFNARLKEDSGDPRIEELKKVAFAMADKALAAAQKANGDDARESGIGSRESGEHARKKGTGDLSDEASAKSDGFSEGKIIDRIEPPKTGGKAGTKKQAAGGRRQAAAKTSKRAKPKKKALRK